MADYTRGTGSGGVMLIRDQGWNVEFHIQAGYSSTFVEQLYWRRYVNGAWSGRLGPVRYNTGRPWVHLDTFAVTYNQTIYFRLEATNTDGLGGQTDFPQLILRATVPPAPIPSFLTQTEHTRVNYGFNANGNGGANVLEWQVGYGTNASSVQFTMNGGSGTVIVNGLSLGEMWYFWARGRNSVGWGPWSSRSNIRTFAGSRMRVAGVWREAVAMVKVAGVWRQAIPYIKTAGVWKDGK